MTNSTEMTTEMTTEKKWDNIATIFKLVAEKNIEYSNVFKGQISGSIHCYELIKSYYQDKADSLVCERFGAIFLDRSNKVISIAEISQGGVSATVVDAKILFLNAIKNLASGIILFHNHPSGNRRPSQQDIALTKKLVEGSKLIDMEIIDHLIYTGDNLDYYSFRDEGDI